MSALPRIVAAPTANCTPRREWDWGAYLEGREEDGYIGMGATREEAIADARMSLFDDGDKYEVEP